MSRQFCYVCGKEPFKEGLCKDCFKEPEEKKKEEKVIEQCTRCGYYKDKMKWKYSETRLPGAKKFVCIFCNKRLSHYYETVIQLRGNFTPATARFTGKEIDRIGKKDRLSFYTVKDVRGGLDFKVGSKAATKTVVGFLRKKGAEVKTSYEQVTEIDGKPVNRSVFSVRFAQA
ncbi:MAG: hypothetical protein HY362_02145 [Candidatus Aenigmarchaeota archaeon]|nr:hypothetical protein [Candidatus Aenigmarchaeota archaeon]